MDPWVAVIAAASGILGGVATKLLDWMFERSRLKYEQISADAAARRVAIEAEKAERKGVLTEAYSALLKLKTAIHSGGLNSTESAIAKSAAVDALGRVCVLWRDNRLRNSAQWLADSYQAIDECLRAINRLCDESEVAKATLDAPLVSKAEPWDGIVLIRVLATDGFRQSECDEGRVVLREAVRSCRWDDIPKTQRTKIRQLYFDKDKDIPRRFTLGLPSETSSWKKAGDFWESSTVWSANLDPEKTELPTILDAWERSYDEAENALLKGAA